MATGNTIAPEPFNFTSSGGEFDDEDFITKQFLSQSMGYADDILLAMAPLGILTCVISAIRVGGRQWLRALVGRARESRATVEMELLSCTSDAICELWSGTEIVRERGIPQTKEFIYRKIDQNDGPADVEGHRIVFDLKTACQHGIMTGSRPRLDDPRTRGVSMEALHAEMIRHAIRVMKQAPNLTLNVPDATLSVLVIAALVTYHWRVPDQGSMVVSYGFPVFALGTVTLSGGIFISSYIIEAHTEEVDFILVNDTKNTKIIRIQRACTVGDQGYGSAFVRRGLAANPKVVKLIEGHELSWVMMDACGIDSLKTTPEIWLGVDGFTGQSWQAQFDSPNPALGHMRSLPTVWLARTMVEGRRDIAQLVPWGDDCYPLAQQLATAIIDVLQFISEERNAFDLRKIPLVFKDPPRANKFRRGPSGYPTTKDFDAAVESRGFDATSGFIEYRLQDDGGLLRIGFQWQLE
ncbi:hypothetical protein BDW71DRAFT_204528 [Aspergillus fruticulosus]